MGEAAGSVVEDSEEEVDSAVVTRAVVDLVEVELEDWAVAVQVAVVSAAADLAEGETVEAVPEAADSVVGLVAGSVEVEMEVVVPAVVDSVVAVPEAEDSAGDSAGDSAAVVGSVAMGEALEQN